MRFDNPPNFRDLAHHVTGGPRPGVLFRSDHLGSLTEDDARQIKALGIRRVLDFRGVDERTSAACTLPDVAVHSLSIEPTIVQVLNGLVNAGHELTQDEVVAHMCDTYRGFVLQSTNRFAEFFALLLESDEPTVFHCTAGKDRTGLAAALILHALDVSPADIWRDYLLTNDRLKPLKMTGWVLPRHVAEVLYRVQPEFLQAAYDTIDAQYGSLQTYLRDGLKLGDAERKRLKALYQPG
ncbi:MAG: tyrosine-protein phosphatase [Pseudomonadota bacterium]